MSYHIYQTEGFVLSGTDAGESSRFLHIYTKDLGLIGVWGQGLRKIESKLRYNLQDFSNVYVNIVRGKRMWRITDVEQLKTVNNILNSRQKLAVLGQITSLMKRLLDEERDDALYSLFSGAVSFLETNKFSRNELICFELLYVLRMLHRLGYGKNVTPKELLISPLWNSEVLMCVEQQKIALMRLINSSLQQTHM